MTKPLTAQDIVRLLDLKPHPEGGHYRETWRADAALGERSDGTAIYYLLGEGEISHWHRIDADEIWHWHAGSALDLGLSHDGRHVDTHRLGPDMAEGERPQVIVPRFCWQTARSLGSWTLVGCTVSPAFAFYGFEMAPKGWRPG
jgi:predicted cupin superfamily sugar epimerase